MSPDPQTVLGFRMTFDVRSALDVRMTFDVRVTFDVLQIQSSSVSGKNVRETRALTPPPDQDARPLPRRYEDGAIAL